MRRKPCLSGAYLESSEFSQLLLEAVLPMRSSWAPNSCRKVHCMVVSLSSILSIQHAAPVLFCPFESASILQTVPSSQPSSRCSRLPTKS